MLRVPLRGGKLVAGASARAGHSQWLATRRILVSRRRFADLKKPDETLVPGSASRLAPETTSPIPELTPTSTTVIENIPKLPPQPPGGVAPLSKAEPGPSAPPPPPIGTVTASVTPKKPRRRLRRFLLTLITLSILGYGGSVWFSLVSDNFHDFFTEYVPFAEDAVGYFEEREFRRRFPGGASDSRLRAQVRSEGKVTIPGRGGVTARIAEEPSRRSSDLGVTGSHMSAVDQPAAIPQTPRQASGAEAVQEAKKSQPEKQKVAPEPALKVTPSTETKAALKVVTPTPVEAQVVVEPAKPLTTSPIDKLAVPNAEEPVVQDVVKIINDIIAVVNADDAAGKYRSTIAKAKGDLDKVIGDIETMKTMQAKAAEDQIRSSHIEFDRAAEELIKRLEIDMASQEARWKDEYEMERQKLVKSYDVKLRGELETTRKVYDQRLKNELLEQAIAMRKEFSNSVKNRVETERSGRLGKLDELSAGVKDLEKLTSEWNSVVDSNLKTQRLLVAVESVRNTLEKAEAPKPFTSELAALKEVASDDPVVNAAIASINPTAYQRGIPSLAMLIDRFRRVSTEVRKAALLPENAGVASHIVSLALSKFMFKKSGLPTGQDVESVLTRAEMLLEEGDLDAAAREVNGLQGWAKVISRDWLTECRRVLEVQQALDVIATEARLQSLLVE